MSEEPVPMQEEVETVEPETAEPETVEQEAEAKTMRRSGRKRKKPEIYTVEKAKEKDHSLPDGSGTAFQDIPLVKHRLDKIKSDHQVTKALHTLCFNRVGKKFQRKRNLRQFHGLDEEDDLDKKRARLMGKNHTVESLKLLTGFLGLSTSGSKEQLVSGLLEFLQSPTDSGAEPTPFKGRGAKRKRKSSSKKTSKRKKSGPRKTSGYMLFVNTHRPGAREENPEMKMIEITKLLAGKWRALSDKKKEHWKAKAAAMPASSKQSKGKTSRKKAKKPRQESSEDEATDDDESSDDEPLAGEDDIEDRLQKAIKKIVEEGDLTQLNKSKVRALLRPEFGEDVVQDNKAFIKATIKQCAAEKNTRS